MNYEEALEFVHCGFFGGTRPGLERVSELLAKLGNPEKKLRFIHVTGTNDKGSFCAMTDSILRAAGYGSGLFTSPYIVRFNERMRFRGEPIGDGELAGILTRIRPAAEAMEDRPTEFELITAAAMLWFAEKKADPVVLEVGMGGRLDATNVIDPDSTLLSVITGISLDHTSILGDTTEKIASEKAGIIKPGVPVLWCGDDSAAGKVIETVAKERGSRLFRPSRKASNAFFTLDGTVFDYGRVKGLKLPLLGDYQLANAENVLSAVKILGSRGIVTGTRAVRLGLETVTWPARFELLGRDPVFVYDGGHNPEGVAAALESVNEYFGGRAVFVSGMLADKDWKKCAGMISAAAEKVFCVSPPGARALDARTLAAKYSELGTPSEACVSYEEAVASAVGLAKRISLPVLCLGSLYMYSDIKKAAAQVFGGK